MGLHWRALVHRGSRTPRSYRSPNRRVSDRADLDSNADLNYLIDRHFDVRLPLCVQSDILPFWYYTGSSHLPSKKRFDTISQGRLLCSSFALQ